MDGGWVALIVLGVLCLLSSLWSLITAPRLNVRGKHVLFTGTETPLGLAIAIKFIKKGANISLIGPSLKSLKAAQQELQKVAGPNSAVFVFECDLIDSQQVANAVQEANAFHERPTDYIVYAAHRRLKPGYFWKQDVALMKEAMNANYYGAVVLLKAALPAMIEAKNCGRIVFVSSVDALEFPVGSGATSGSKSAIRGLADSLRNELLLYNMSVAVYYPGTSSFNLLDNIETDEITNEVVEDKRASEDHITTSYSTFMDHDTAAARLVEKKAQILLNGLWLGNYAITTTWNGFFLRMLSNGVAPRNNTFLEWILLFFVGLYHSLRQAVKERSLKTPVQAAATSAPV